MARGDDDSAFESMVVAVDVDGALPLPIQQLDPQEEVAVRGALRRLTFRRQALRRRLHPDDDADDSQPPPSQPPRYVQGHEPRERFGPWAQVQVDQVEEASDTDDRQPAIATASPIDPTNLDQIAHHYYGS